MSHTLDDPSDFCLPELQAIDEALRCPICKELFNTALIIATCSHSFCALCVRRSLSAEQCCPTCRKGAFESNLKNNYDLDNVVAKWKAARSATVRLGTHNDTPNQPIVGTHGVEVDAAMNLDNHRGSDFTIGASSASRTSPSSSQTRRSTRLGQTIQPAENGSPSTDKDPLVSCPNCNQDLKCSKINQHLDVCLGLQVPVPSPSSSSSLPFRTHTPLSQEPPKKKLKPELYGMQKDKDLRRLLKELGLPTNGSRKQMIQRHKEYVTLYNSNQDSARPVGTATLIRQLNKWEETLTTQLKPAATDSDAHKAKYRDEYAQLIASARKRRETKTETSPPSPSPGQSNLKRKNSVNEEGAV